MDEDTGKQFRAWADTQCAGQENIEEREQAGTLVATRCTVLTAGDRLRQTALQQTLS